MPINTASRSRPTLLAGAPVRCGRGAGQRDTPHEIRDDRATMDLEVARNFLIALAIGALVGIEREKKRATDPAASLGGIRTHILLALLGAASARIGSYFDLAWVLPVTLLVVGAAVVASYLLQNREEEVVGLTSETAAFAVCLLGAMAALGEPGLAVALGVATSAVLAYKKPLHTLVGRIGTEDLFAGIKLLVASFIVLPLLPNETVDPWGAINPYKLWLLVVFISGLSLVGYVAMRWLGSAHGTAATGIAGGLVSSTAATLSFAREAQAEPGAARAHALAAGTLLAWSVMLLRVMVLIAVVNRELLTSEWLRLAALAVVTVVFAIWHYRAGLAGQRTQGEEGPAVGNPFSLSAAIKFGALFAAMLLVVKLAQAYAPGFGLYLVSALAGTVDVDAITLSMSQEAGDSGNYARAGTAIIIALLSNTIVKCGMVISLGKGAVRQHVGIATAAILATGIIVSLLGSNRAH
jgi:uncharacterized membrane protein (DUF4010 family)